MDEVLARDWDAFQLRLAAYLSTMTDEDDRLVLAVPTEDELFGTRPYAQAAGQLLEDGDPGLHAELSSNIFLTESSHLGPTDRRRLTRAGWLGATKQHPNYVVELPIGDATRVARMMVRALRDAFAVPHPTLLTVQAWGPAAAGAAVLGLTPVEEVPTDIVDTAAALPMTIAYPDGPGALHQLVSDALEKQYGVVIGTDDDDDFVLWHLDGPVWIRVHTGQPAIEIMAVVAREVASKKRAAVALARLNAEYAWSKWALRGRDVWQTVLWPGVPFVPSQLTGMLDGFFDTMTETQDVFVGRPGTQLA